MRERIGGGHETDAGRLFDEGKAGGIGDGQHAVFLARDEVGFAAGVVEEPPFVEERPVVLGEEPDTDAKAALLDVVGDIVATFSDSLTDAGARDVEVVNRAGYSSPIRTPRGRDILAACGQLKSDSLRARKSRTNETAPPA